jgi:CRP-like cAMP-binding protein
MSLYLIRRLECFVRLAEDERKALRDLSAQGMKILSRRDISTEGDKPKAINVMLDGWAARYKMLEDGRRQLLSILLPGDTCDLNLYILRRMDHSITTISPAHVSRLTPLMFERLTRDFPRLGQAFLWESLVSLAIQREWTLNIGQRTAFERIAHLVCELYVRLAAVGQVVGGVAKFPITQTDVAEATGLTVVHVNRSIQELRRQGLIVWQGRTLEVPDLSALKDAALFDDNYLHLNREGAHLDANN